jgi:hypothetical protein
MDNYTDSETETDNEGAGLEMPSDEHLYDCPADGDELAQRLAERLSEEKEARAQAEGERDAARESAAVYKYYYDKQREIYDIASASCDSLRKKFHRAIEAEARTAVQASFIFAVLLLLVLVFAGLFWWMCEVNSQLREGIRTVNGAHRTFFPHEVER